MAHAMLRARRAPGRGRRDRGAVAVEFALIMPILVTLVFGIISYGYMLSFRQAISQGAAEGARAGAVTDAGGDVAASARGAVNNALDSYGVACSGNALERDGTVVGECKVYVGVWPPPPAVMDACDDSFGGDASRDVVVVKLNYDYDNHPLIPPLYADLVMPNDLCYIASAETN